MKLNIFNRTNRHEKRQHKKRRHTKRQKAVNSGYCRKCGCELVSTSKRKLCDNCRRTRAKTIRDAAMSIGAVFGAALFIRKDNGKK